MIRLELALLFLLLLAGRGVAQQNTTALLTGSNSLTDAAQIAGEDPPDLLALDPETEWDADDKLIAPAATVSLNVEEPSFFQPPVDDNQELVACQEIELEAELPEVAFGDWLGYNSTEGDFGWLTGNGDRLGIFSIESFPTLDLDSDSAITFGSGFHFINGPTATDLPPRLFDFQLAYHSRKIHSDRFMLDYRLGIGVFSDFEGSARKGVRFPGHAVSYFELDPWLISVIGVEVLDRDDVSVLPVIGFVWRPDEDIIYELVFPRPKIQVRATTKHSIYVAGELGGGTWAIERANQTNDNVTYRDFRILLGWVDFDDSDSAFELGWAFGRKLDYRSAVGNYYPDDTLLIRLRTFY